MSDPGISLTELVISGSALTTLGGIIGVWIKSRYGQTRITPQPLSVCETKASAPPELCAERHKVLDGQIAVLFASMNRQNNAEGRLAGIEKQVSSMDGKLDAIIKELAKGRK